MTDAQQRESARQFFYRWNGKGREDEDARSYWIEILTNILGFDRVTERVDFEKKVVGGDGNTKRIDVYIPETHVLIEQKSLGIALDKPQAGHNGMTPYEQAKYYDNYLPFSERARWIITSNFEEIWIYDRDAVKPDPVKITLTDLPAKYHMLNFLVNKEVKKVTDEMNISLQAGELVGQLYDAFLKQYKDPENEETLKSLNKLCVRIVFCLYAEDASVFGKKSMFHDYMQQFDAAHARKGLRDLFRVLNQKPEDRDPYLADDDPMLAAFPYVNGGLCDRLFSDIRKELSAVYSQTDVMKMYCISILRVDQFPLGALSQDRTVEEHGLIFPERYGEVGLKDRPLHAEPCLRRIHGSSSPDRRHTEIRRVKSQLALRLLAKSKDKRDPRHLSPVCF